jgi:hypothetical protein
MSTCFWLKSPLSDWSRPLNAALSLARRLSNATAPFLISNFRRSMARAFEEPGSAGLVVSVMLQFAVPSSSAISESRG